MKESTRFKNKKLANTNNGVKKAAKGARTGAKIVGIGLAIVPITAIVLQRLEVTEYLILECRVKLFIEQGTGSNLSIHHIPIVEWHFSRNNLYAFSCQRIGISTHMHADDIAHLR